MKEQLQKIFAPQSTEGFLCMLGIVILLGVLLYAGYRKFYEKRINQVLTGKKVRILSLEAIMILYFIASVISVLVYMGNVYALPNQQIVEETCNVENGYVDFGNTREGVEKKIRELQKQAKTTFIHQEKKNKDGTISMYAEADGKSYIYAIVYPYTYPLENEEDVILGTKLQGAIKDLFPTGCFIPVSPGKDVLCYFSPSINKNIDVEVGSKVLFTINKNCDGKFRGKVVEVLR